MAASPWLASGRRLGDGVAVGELLDAGARWQLLDSHDGQRLLLAAAGLAEGWVAGGLLAPGQIETIATDAGAACGLLRSGLDLTLAPLQRCARPRAMSDALAFAASLRATRALLPDAALAESIFCERHARLLPIEPQAGAPLQLADDVLLGRFLTGGVQVSATDLRAMQRLTGWMRAADIRAVLDAAGLAETAPRPAPALTRRRTQEVEPDAAAGSGVAGRPSRLDTTPAGAQRGPFRLPGRPALERFFSEHIIDVVADPERYARFGIGFPGAVVLHGPPGSGKTFAVQRLIDYLGWPAIAIDSGSVGSPYIHETSRKLAELFDEAAALAPAVVTIDEMEAFVADRQAHQAGGLHHVEETAQLLQRIPAATANRVLVIGMTNHLDMIDAAMLRRGRFDHIIEVGMPGLDEVRALLDALLAERPVVDAPDRGALAGALAGRPLSDAAFVVREAARLAARAGRDGIARGDLDAALAGLPARTDAGARPIGFIWD